MNPSGEIRSLLADMLPDDVCASTPDAPDLEAYVRVGGVEHVVRVDRVQGPHFVVSHPGVELDFGEALVLSIVLAASAVRLDASVSVVRTGGFMSTVKLRGRPLVMRRRIVRNHKLEEALGMPEHESDARVGMVA